MRYEFQEESPSQRRKCLCQKRSPFHRKGKDALGNIKIIKFSFKNKQFLRSTFCCFEGDFAHNVLIFSKNAIIQIWGTYPHSQLRGVLLEQTEILPLYT